MGRPPSLQGRRGGDAVYSPLWLTGERPPTKKQFAVPIPPVDPAVHAAIASRIAPRQPWLVQRAQLGEAESILVEVRETQEETSARLQELQQARARALGEIKALRQQQLEQALIHVERNIRLNFRQEQARKQASLDALCEELLQQEPPTIEERPEQKAPAVEEEEPPTKRARLEEEDKNEPQEEEDLEDGELGEEEGRIMEEEEEETLQSTTSEEVKPSELKKQELEVGWNENVAIVSSSLVPHTYSTFRRWKVKWTVSRKPRVN